MSRSGILWPAACVFFFSCLNSFVRSIFDRKQADGGLRLLGKF